MACPLLLIGLLGPAWGTPESASERNWQDLLVRVADAMYSDAPIEQLDGLAEEVAGDSLAYRADPVGLVRHAESFLSQLPDSLYRIERDFWQRGAVDTMFLVTTVDVTGDGRTEEVRAEVWRDRHQTFLRLYIGLGVEAMEILKHRIWHSEEWGSIPQPAYTFSRAVEFGQHAEFVPAERGFVIPSIIHEEVAGLSSSSPDDVKEDVDAYVTSFKGKAVWASDGVNGSCHIYYKPLNRFVLLYRP